MLQNCPSESSRGSIASPVRMILTAIDPERVARFQREAHLPAALNHPHIAAIHELDEAHGTQFLVMELVEGETLAARLQTGPIPVPEAAGFAPDLRAGV
jgi:serine/threonine-protein kinase